MINSSHSLILESLNADREQSSNSGIKESLDFFESLRDSTNLDINEEFYRRTTVDIDEATMVTFDGQMYPTSGYAVVLVGATGSGKGWVCKHKIALDSKVFDVDRLKELYILAVKHGKVDDKEYDLKNSKDVSDLHQKVKELGIKNKQEEAFYKSVRSGNLPNVLYDITGDNAEKLKKLGNKLKGIGYKVSLVWVVTNRQVAMLQNLSRDRVVSQQVFHQIHNEVIKNVFPFLKNGASDYDEAWLVFNSKDSAKELSPKERKHLDGIGTVKLEKSGKSFIIPKEIEMMLFNILGPVEKDVNHPQTYKDFSEIQGHEDVLDRVKAGRDTLLKKV